MCRCMYVYIYILYYYTWLRQRTHFYSRHVHRFTIFHFFLTFMTFVGLGALQSGGSVLRGVTRPGWRYLTSILWLFKPWKFAMEGCSGR